MAEIYISASSIMHLNQGTDEALVSRNTGREVSLRTFYEAVKEWVFSGNPAIHPLVSEVEDALSKASLLSGGTLRVCRGRTFATNDPKRLIHSEYAPNLISPRANRYNRSGTAAWYLAETDDAIIRELTHHKAVGDLHIMEFALDLDDLKIADFVTSDPKSLLAAVFEHAEYCNVDGRGVNSYEFSQIVGAMVSARFDGMQVPGVRGTTGAHYSNVVLFRRLDEWERWKASGASPRFVTTI